MKRKIVKIHEDRCTGCGLCVDACHEGAIELKNGVAVLVSDIYCDGLGDCLPHCPADAIEIIERDALEYDDDAVQKRKNKKEAPVKQVFNGPVNLMGMSGSSELMQWPVQLKFVNPDAPCFKDAHLLVAADCTAYAYGDFHKTFIKGRTIVVGCPKLGDNESYKEKLTEILRKNDIKSLTIVRMEVPCCRGIIGVVKEALEASGKDIEINERIVSTNGSLMK